MSVALPKIPQTTSPESAPFDFPENRVTQTPTNASRRKCTSPVAHWFQPGSSFQLSRNKNTVKLASLSPSPGKNTTFSSSAPFSPTSPTPSTSGLNFTPSPPSQLSLGDPLCDNLVFTISDNGNVSVGGLLFGTQEPGKTDQHSKSSNLVFTVSPPTKAVNIHSVDTEGQVFPNPVDDLPKVSKFKL